MISAKDLKELASSLNVLYAEDEEMLKDSMKGSLDKFFKNTFVASDGKEAFEIFKKEDIDLIITDINMPIMTGTELIKSVQKYTDKEPIIIVLSAHDESRLLTGLINLGIDFFINKPPEKQILINSLYKACKIITDKKLVAEYELKLQNELETAQRKNKILEQKLNQLAIHKNKTLPKKEQKPEQAKYNYFDTLLQEDRDEISDLSIELDSYIAMMFQNEKLNENYLQVLSDKYKKYSAVLNTYTEFTEIAAQLHHFSQTILALGDKFMQNIPQTGIYFESLQLSLEHYRENIWNKEAKDPTFYNASLISDIQLVIDFLEGNETQENEIEFF